MSRFFSGDAPLRAARGGRDASGRSEHGVHAASSWRAKGALECSAALVSSEHFCGVNAALRGAHSVSPNGAMTYQPRAERSAALGCRTERTASPEGVAHGRPAGRGVGRPFRALRTKATETQGDALGWNGSAPLGLNRYQGETLLAVRCGFKRRDNL